MVTRADAESGVGEDDGEGDEHPGRQVGGVETPADEDDDHWHGERECHDSPAEGTVGASPGAAAEGEEHTEWEGQGDAGDGEEEVEHHPLPLVPRRRSAQEPHDGDGDDDSRDDDRHQPPPRGEAADDPADDGGGDDEHGQHGRTWRRGERQEHDHADDERPDAHGQVGEPSPERRLSTAPRAR